MAKILIKGGKKLSGKIKLAGNKNSALKLMAASLIADSPTTLTNMPKIKDIEVMGKLIESLGGKVKGIGTNTLTIDPRSLSSYELDPALAGRIRASVVLAAPLLARFRKAIITPPGGDQIGERLIDTHFSMMRKMGVHIKRSDGKYLLTWKKPKSAYIFLEEASVTATEMGMIMAASAEVETQLDDAACEPHVRELGEFLNKMGAKVEGGGTHTLRIRGRKKLNGNQHKIFPDYLEGGTFAIAAAITGGKLLIEDYILEDYRMIIHYLESMGVKTREAGKKKLLILPSELSAKRRKFQTRTWPGFPTDMISPFIVLATQTKGTILCHDWMFEWRIFFVDDLISMGANIFIADPHRVIVTGPTKLHGENLFCKDIRAGISIILATLAAEGQSVIDSVETVERGYENIEQRLNSIGASIKRI